MDQEDLDTKNLNEREQALEIIKPKLKNLFFTRKFGEFNVSMETTLKKFILPKQKYDRFSKYTPYTPQVMKVFNLPNYVNASFVFYPNCYNYICFMHPKKEYISDFEDFLFFSNTKLIISLNQIGISKGEEFDYLENNKNFIKTNESIISDIILDELYVFKKGTKYEKTIQRIRFLKWADFDIPNTEEFLKFHNYYLNTISLNGYELNRYFTISVHCLAGVGRTGTFVCFDIINRILKEMKGKVEEHEVFDIIFDVLCKVKLHRKGMVQTQDQISWMVDYFINAYSIIKL